MKKGIWSNQEVKELFNQVEQTKKSGRPLKDAFIAHAERYTRKPNSVRNYYYHEIDQLGNDLNRLKKLGIDLEKHKKTAIVFFSSNEEQSLMQEITKLIDSGMSVRKACLTLSNGNVEQMLRFQNKYRNYLVKQKSEAIDNTKVIKFTKKKTTLNDNDIQSLFMGLVRLVKRNALEQINDKYKSEFDRVSNELRKAIVEIHNKEKAYSELKNEIAKLQKDNAKLSQDVMKLRCDRASKLKEKLSIKQNANVVEA